MALMHAKKRGRAAFTLVELLVVIGIMAVLATISVTGYTAATRGMADRGVIQSTVSILRVAQQTCEIDRVPTKVFFFNRRLSDGSSEDDATLYQGTAIAVKQAGRITIAPRAVGGLLIDEFADWHQSYPMTGSANAPGMRLFRMKDSDESKDIKDCSVMVQPFVTAYQLDDYLIQAGVTIKQWCDTHKRTAGDNRPQGASSTYVNNGNNYIWGFAASSANSGGNLSTDSWLAGDPYGVEIARIDLPKGYIFGSSAPNSDTLVSASDKAVNFDPEDFEPKPSPGRVQVSAMRPSGSTYSPKSIGTVDASMLDDKNH